MSILKKSFLISLLLLSAVFTYAATPLYPHQGGTGTSTKPTYGQLLMGDGSGLYVLTATSSLGISSGSSALADLTDVNLTALATGAILFYNGTDWANLAIGTSGQVLKVNGGTPYWGTDISGVLS